jgi:MYXO-CTERM domain-containing protein
MTRFRLAILAALLAPSAATAGPIAWSYSSSGASEGGYGFDPASLAFDTEEGEIQQIYLVNGGGWAPWMVSPIPVEGPTLWTAVTLWDTASGEAYTFRVPVEFYDNEPAPEGEWDTHVPQIGTITPFDLRLGKNKYHVAPGPWLTLNVSVSETPEPATFLMGAVGLAGLGLVRRRIGRVEPTVEK